MKFDGFRALARLNGHHCQLIRETVSGSGVGRTSPAERANNAVLDGEIVCQATDGCSRFRDRLFRREWPYFLAFLVRLIDGEDPRTLPLVECTCRLARVLP